MNREHGNPPVFGAGNQPTLRAVQKPAVAEDPDASLSDSADRDTGPAARRGCAGPTGSSGAPRRLGAGSPVVPALRTPRRSRSGRGRTDCRSAPSFRSGHSRSGAARTAPPPPYGVGGLLCAEESGSLRRGGPWVLPGLLRATRSVSLTAESLLAFLLGLSRPARRGRGSPGGRRLRSRPLRSWASREKSLLRILPARTPRLHALRAFLQRLPCRSPALLSAGRRVFAGGDNSSLSRGSPVTEATESRSSCGSPRRDPRAPRAAPRSGCQM